MCGIFGFVVKENKKYSERFIKSLARNLFLLSESRGKDSSGIAIYSKGEFLSYKAAIPARELIKARDYQKLWRILNKKDCFACGLPAAGLPFAVIGHTRLATNGTEQDFNNNQPISVNNIIGVHNGIIVNSGELGDFFRLNNIKGISDSEVLFALLDLFISQKGSLSEATKELFLKIEGSASVAAFIKNSKNLIIGTNTGSLYTLINSDRSFYIFASELPILQEIEKTLKLADVIGEYSVRQINAGTGEQIDLDSLGGKKIDFNLISKEAKIEVPTLSAYFRSLINQIIPDDDSKYWGSSLKRCTRCLLPETIPYIEFDVKGVCNYCLDHKKIEYKGRDALEEIAARYRRTDGRPDCIVAFSGGRDSSYTLHYVKKVLKMNPIAFTFDWGMVADIARRNQARMVGKLGVEHVIISDDIHKKRKFIRDNIKAWLKKPHLGMVVLFMAGDKPAEYYVREVAKKRGIELVFLCRGNELENTDFKWGFLGLRKGEPKGVMHDLSLPDRLAFTFNSVWQFIRNPAYFNSSVHDIFFDYWTTYVITYNFLYFWHYIPWNESEVVSTLKSEYNWEVSKDTIQTWRTDDGTSPFYNYIYYIMAGFTENDNFRSNQIREGLLTREEGMRIVLAENRPRYEAIKDYLDKIGLNYKEVTSKIEAFPKFRNKR